MDMATVVIKLLTGEYENEGNMVADLRLMLDNCRRWVTSHSLSPRPSTHTYIRPLV